MHIGFSAVHYTDACYFFRLFFVHVLFLCDGENNSNKIYIKYIYDALFFKEDTNRCTWNNKKNKNYSCFRL